MLLTFIRAVKESADSASFYFRAEQDLNFLPGQYCYLTLEEAKRDPRGPTRQFTISSGVDDEFVRFTVRLSNSYYKQALLNLKHGDKAIADGPHGVFYFTPSESGKHVFLAGGIGVTPFVSILRSSTTSLKAEINLVQFDRNKASIPLSAEIYALNQTLSFTYHPILGNDMDIAETLRRIDLVSSDATYWLSGPPGFVDNAEKVLACAVDMDNIRFDKFTGYSEHYG